MRFCRKLRRWLFLAFWCCVPGAHAQGTLAQILANGPNDRRINIVILSEGYTVGELPRFSDDARQVLDGFLSTPPYSEYRDLFNAFTISVASAESGSDHPSQNIFRNTYFNSTFDSYGINRLLTIPPNDLDNAFADGRGKVNDLLAKYLPDYDLVFMVVNDPQYGGSGGQPIITSLNGSSQEILVHESGHSFGGLGDEYTTPYPGYPDTEEPNTTRETHRTLIKWKAWIDNSTPLPTPPVSTYATVVGLFEGAHYHSTGWYRPMLDCKMRTLGQPFCRVCSETLVKAVYGLLQPIESASPTSTSIYLPLNLSETLQITPLQPQTHQLTLQWSVDQKPLVGATNTSLVLGGDALGVGAHHVTVEVRDPTPLVRIDPEHLLEQSRSWSLQVTNAAPAPVLKLADISVAGEAHLTILNPAAESIRLDRSSDLLSWSPVFTNRSGAATMEYTDPAAPSVPYRFYRATLLP